MLHRLLPLGTALLAGCAATSSSGGGLAATPVTGFDNDDGVFLYSAGMEALLVDEKDAGLLSALRLLDDRLVELPEELGEGGEVPADAIELPVQALLGPMSLRAGYAGMDVAAQGAAPFYVQFGSTQPDAAAAHAFAGRVAGLLADQIPPGQRGDDGLTHIQLGGPLVASHGVVDRDFVVAVGGVAQEPLRLGGMGLPDGVEPVFGFKLDFAQYLAVLEDFSAMMGPDGAEMMQIMETLGVGELEIQSVAGVGPDRTYTTTWMPGYARTLPEGYGGPDAVVARETLAMVPADAVWASLGVMDLSAMLEMIVGMLRTVPDFEQELGGADPLDVVEQFTGIHPARDLFDHLGSQWGMYMAESTGGGGLGSLVLFADVEDPEALRATLAKLGGMANGAADQFAEGYVELREWSHAGHPYTSLTFPGLPVPLELTYTFEGRWLIEGLTPQAVVAAVEQARGGRSLLDERAFRDMVVGPLDDLFAVSYLNTPALLADGYGWASFLSSALANGVRSRTDASRAAGLILPPYEVLAAGAKPMVTVSRLVGDDLVAHGRSDRSTLVNLTGFAGLVDRIPALLIVPMAIGATIGAAAESQAAAPFVYEAF